MKRTILTFFVCVSICCGAFAQNYFPSSGNVGIGTLSPQTPFHIQGNVESVVERIESLKDGYASFELKSNNKFWQWSKRPGNEGDALGLYYNNGTWNSVMIIATNGNVGMGTVTPTEKLSVNGNIRTKKVIVTQSNWPDYVFESSYQLPSLDSISSFIKANKHLPEMPSASAIEKEGQDVGEIQKLLLKKVEELTLYVISQEERIKQLEEENKKLKN